LSLEKLPSAEDVADKLPSAEALADKLPSAEGVADKLPSAEALADKLPCAEGVADKLPSAEGVADKLPSAEGVADKLPSAEGVADWHFLDFSGLDLIDCKSVLAWIYGGQNSAMTKKKTNESVCSRCPPRHPQQEITNGKAVVRTHASTCL
jgi:hypothetical protein